jgi:hypothetical protein
MMPDSSHISDYSRYFCPGQKVYLVNMSEERNNDLYESLSGVVTSSSKNLLELTIAHGETGAVAAETGVITYKLTSETLGSGIQVLADLTETGAGNLCQFRIHGTLELFQRRIVSRAEFSASIFHISKKMSLTAFKKEWQRVCSHLTDTGELPGLVLRDTRIDLSAGGIGLTVDSDKRPLPLSMFFIGMDEGLPVCALAETVWDQRVEGGLRCGFRFVHILKADQQRIDNKVVNEIRKNGGATLDYKRNWVLVDKMVADLRKPS